MQIHFWAEIEYQTGLYLFALNIVKEVLSVIFTHFLRNTWRERETLNLYGFIDENIENTLSSAKSLWDFSLMTVAWACYLFCELFTLVLCVFMSSGVVE